MIEWCKKYLGWLGFIFFLLGGLLTFISDYFYNINISELAFSSFGIMAACQTIQALLLKSISKNWSDKKRSLFIYFIIIISLIIFVFLPFYF